MAEERSPTSPPPQVPDAELDRLYGLPREEFTSARNELAKRLGREGEREAAGWVRGLEKPTAAAWAANQVVRTQRKPARALLRAGEELARMHEAVAGGKARPADLRKVVERERDALGQLVEAARGLLSAKGTPLSERTIDQVGETLHAAALDPHTREAVGAGRLTRERQAVGLGPLVSAARAPEAKPARPPDRAQEADRKRRLEAARREVRRIGGEQRKLRKGLADAKRRVERAEGAAEDAREKEAQARAALQEADRQLRKAQNEADRLGG
jgi:hypothetical protein